MALEEKISEHLNVPYVYMPEHKKFLCSNGVMFTLEEYKNGLDLNVEYERRAKEDKLYDYAYAKSTGLLRKKRSLETVNKSKPKNVNKKDVIETKDVVKIKDVVETKDNAKSVTLICLLLAFVSVISMYISTLHTATYLADYSSLISAWLMSASVTAYNSTAFEVSILFHKEKRNLMAFIFMFLWVLVTLFSMATTISVFYDAFNFQETQIAQENKKVDSNKLALEILQKKEEALRKDIDFKKKDIEYRQEKEYATTTVRNELTKLQDELQRNLSEQETLLKETPEVTEEKIKRKESLFSFLGRILHIENGILEFIMSTLSAIFINLIAPLSVTAFTELKERTKRS